MLIKCPECELQISDKAAFCPHCGYVITKSKVYTPKRSNKRRRLPNGFGQITELKNQHLRKRFRVSITVRKTEDGKCVQKLLKPTAYFETYNAAYEALVEYNRNPYEIDKTNTTLKELYEKWFSEYRKTLKAKSSERTITAAWGYCSDLYDAPVKSIRARHIKGVIENGVATVNGREKTPTPNIKGRIKSLFNLMFDYAVEYELTDRNYARTFNLSDEIVSEMDRQKRAHIPFSKDELKILWKNADKHESYVDLLLYQCYSGWRPQELGLIKLDDVNLEKMEIRGGMKTDAGINRVVPIHPKVIGIVERYYNEAISANSEYLFNCFDGKTHSSSIKMTYDKYSYRLEKLIKAFELNPEHRAHDGRNTFITMCKNAGVDEYAIKYMVGHAIIDITESVYTKRDPLWLHNEIAKIF